MDPSPIDQLLSAIDKLDIEGAMAGFAPDCRMLTADGRRSEGHEAVRELLTDFLAQVRSTTHHLTAEWHQDGVWIAEAEATYVLRDWLEMRALPRALFLRDGPDGFVDLRVYGANERPLAEHRTGEEGMRIGRRWIPPL